MKGKGVDNVRKYSINCNFDIICNIFYWKNNIINNWKKVIYEKIDIYIKEEDIPKDLKISDEYKCGHEGEILIITPYEKSYNWLAIYECKYNEKNKNLKKVKELKKFEKIMNNTSIRIDTILACGIPLYIIDFERSDFIKGTLILQSNGKNGIQEEMLTFHHTWKSVIYYLFR